MSVVRVTYVSYYPPPPGPYPANAGNTGYQNAGAILGGGPYTYSNLLDGSGLSLQNNTNYNLYNFPSGLSSGSFASGSSAVNITFTGCRFASNSVNDANVNTVGTNITYRYCTFEPSTVAPGSEPPVNDVSYQIANGSGYQYGINQTNSGPVTVDHCRMWGFANAIQIGASTAVAPFRITTTLFQNARADGGVDHTDGPGQLNNLTGINALLIENNTILGFGNTNALALQAGSYNTATITGNYFAGYGYMVAMGTVTGNQLNFTFTGNTWGTDVEPGFGPLYSGSTGSFAAGAFTTYGNFWQNNKISTYAGTSWMAPGNNGLYWWPSDGNPGSPAAIIGHASDYANS